MLKTSTCVRLNQETLQKIEEIAKKKKRKTSELMRLVLENYVEQFEMQEIAVFLIKYNVYIYSQKTGFANRYAKYGVLCNKYQQYLVYYANILHNTIEYFKTYKF